VRRIIVDTNVYIDWLNDGRHEEVLFGRDTVKYLSAVVLMELRAGAFSPKDRRLVAKLEEAFHGAHRIVGPSPGVFADAGDVLRRLQTERGYRVDAKHSIVNDVLIALSARSIGATVVTQNERDYRAIQHIRPFELQVVTAAT
jgi:predicted nucleic acid-binding protein